MITRNPIITVRYRRLAESRYLSQIIDLCLKWVYYEVVDVAQNYPMMQAQAGGSGHLL